MAHRTLRGRIAYTSAKPERLGQERGREVWNIVVHGDWRRTLQAHCEIDDAPAVVRFVTLSVDHAMRPTDAFVRISVGDEFVGSTWFNFTPASAECEGFTRGEGRFSQRFGLDRPLGGFGTHPLQGDVWFFAQLDYGAGPGETAVDAFVSSLDHRGATGPTLVRLHQKVRYLGIEKVTVAVGTFDAHHVRLGAEDKWDADDPLKHPTYDVWISADDDHLMLLCTVGGYMQTRYELVELERP